jgi:hypothetical protein
MCEREKREERRVRSERLVGTGWLLMMMMMTMLLWLFLVSGGTRTRVTPRGVGARKYHSATLVAPKDSSPNSKHLLVVFGGRLDGETSSDLFIYDVSMFRSLCLPLNR